MTGRDVAVGVAVRNFSVAPALPQPERLIRYVEQAERLGFESAWLFDHVLLGARRYFPMLESLSTMAALSVRTERIALGTGVLVLPLRNPVVLAKAVSTIDYLSGGRLILGLGVGWYEREFRACGVAFRRRGRLFERHLEVLQRLLSEHAVTGTYDDLELRGAVIAPKSAARRRPPILVGGYGPPALERAGALADGWLAHCYSPAGFRRAWAQVTAAAERAGRDPATLDNALQVPICIDESCGRALKRVRAFMGRYFESVSDEDAVAESAICGPPEACVEQLEALVDAGVRRFVFICCDERIAQLGQVAEVAQALQRGERPAPVAPAPRHDVLVTR